MIRNMRIIGIALTTVFASMTGVAVLGSDHDASSSGTEPNTPMATQPPPPLSTSPAFTAAISAGAHTPEPSQTAPHPNTRNSSPESDPSTIDDRIRHYTEKLATNHPGMTYLAYSDIYEDIMNTESYRIRANDLTQEHLGVTWDAFVAQSDQAAALYQQFLETEVNQLNTQSGLPTTTPECMSRLLDYIHVKEFRKKLRTDGMIVPTPDFTAEMNRQNRWMQSTKGCLLPSLRYD